MDGIIIIDKPQGCTSHDIVKKARKYLNKKVGHTGTLDPMATGVLPLLIGKGTLCSKYLVNHDKVYQVSLQLGKKTDTADVEGNIIQEEVVKEEFLERQEVELILKSFIGEQEQTPPIYSAIKVNGKKLYEYARQGKEVEIPKRIINIYSINNTKIDNNKKQIDFEVHCSKGTYIRTLCEDIAKKMQTVGYMKELRRVKVGEFDINDAIDVNKIEKILSDRELCEKYFISIEKLFKNMSQIILDNKKLTLFLNGVRINCNLKDGIYRVYNEGNFVGIGIIKNGLLKRDIVID